MAAVYDSESGSIISSGDDDPEIAARANNLWNSLTSGGATQSRTSYRVKGFCKHWPLSHECTADVTSDKGLSAEYAKSLFIKTWPTCFRCGSEWKRFEVL